METSAVRWRYHLVSAVVVIALLAGYQYWRTTLDWRFLIGVGAVYLAISVGIDLAKATNDDS